MIDLFQSGEIISASRRTDIPRFYSKWFLKRLEEGFVLVRNPFNPNQIRRVSLKPEDVSVIVFWTRDASPLFGKLPELLKRYKIAFLWTITGYGPPLELADIPITKTVENFIKTSEIVGAKKMVWRYDPIIITDEFSPEWHIENFARISESIKRFTRRVIVSLMTPYASVKKRLERAGIEFDRTPLENPLVQNMLKEISNIARQNGQEIQACSQAGKLLPFGIPDGACIDSRWLSEIFGIALPYRKDRGQRPECLCTKSIDIGAYNTCPAGCLYCYAVKSIRAAREFFARFDHNNPGLWR